MKNINNAKNLLLVLFAFVLFPSVSILAQEKSASPTDTIYSVLESVQSDVSLLKKLKITGYVQAQYQKADTAGQDAAFSGGNFASTMNNRFMIRRGRIKFAYENELSQYVMQFDVSEKGFAIKDMYASFTDPWIKAFSLTAGVFNRPFGYEIEYSSSSRETPERSRMYQTLFPGERDLGAKLVIQPWKTSRFNWIKFDIGVVSGNGPNVETDQYKDLIAHLTFTRTFLDEKLKVGIGGSYYNGGVRKVTKYVYSLKDGVQTWSGYVKNSATPDSAANATGPLHTLKAFTADSTGKAGDKVTREYFGLEAQLSLDWAPGLTTLRGEYIFGTQPGLQGANTSFTALPASVTGDLFIRKFSGYYVYFVQNILQTPLGIVVKYDSYDPNSGVNGNDISAYGKEFPKYTTYAVKDPITGLPTKQFSSPIVATGSADIKYSTLGIGLNYRWNSNVKLTLYYEMVRNESTSNISSPTTLKDFSNDRNDNVFTLRLQYKF